MLKMLAVCFPSEVYLMIPRSPKGWIFMDLPACSTWLSPVDIHHPLSHGRNSQSHRLDAALRPEIRGATGTSGHSPCFWAEISCSSSNSGKRTNSIKENHYGTWKNTKIPAKQTPWNAKDIRWQKPKASGISDHGLRRKTSEGKCVVCWFFISWVWWSVISVILCTCFVCVAFR